MKKEDKVDRQRERKRIREKHREIKLKERQERMEAENVSILLILLNICFKYAVLAYVPVVTDEWIKCGQLTLNMRAPFLYI